MTQTETNAILNERRHIAAIIERNQQKLHDQMGLSRADWSRWAIANQWLALEKQRLQILGNPDYREAALNNYHAHTFPPPPEEEPLGKLPNFKDLQPEPSKPKRGRPPKARPTQPAKTAPQPSASPSDAAQQPSTPKAQKKTR